LCTSTRTAAAKKRTLTIGSPVVSTAWAAWALLAADATARRILPRGYANRVRSCMVRPGGATCARTEWFFGNGGTDGSSGCGDAQWLAVARRFRSAGLTAVALDPKGRWVATVWQRGRAYDARTGTAVRICRHTDVVPLVFSPDGASS